jgi:hypothetical protein
MTAICKFKANANSIKAGASMLLDVFSLPGLAHNHHERCAVQLLAFLLSCKQGGHVHKLVDVAAAGAAADSCGSHPGRHNGHKFDKTNPRNAISDP